MAEKTYVYDKAKWHFGNDNYPVDLPIENGYTHIAFFLRWCIGKDFLNLTQFDEQIAAKIPKIKTGEFDCRQFLMQYMDGCLLNGDMNSAGQEFADNYYSGDDKDKHRSRNHLKNWQFFYLDDFAYYQKTRKMTYTKVHQKGAIYSVENTERNYQAIKKLIDRRYKTFIELKNKKTSRLSGFNFDVGINWDFFKRKKN